VVEGQSRDLVGGLKGRGGTTLHQSRLWKRERLVEELVELVLCKLDNKQVSERVEEAGATGTGHLLCPLAQAGDRIEEIAVRTPEHALG